MHVLGLPPASGGQYSIMEAEYSWNITRLRPMQIMRYGISNDKLGFQSMIFAIGAMRFL
ncbi:hypothetical protein SAMN04515619_11286 [Collimonas sp. OK412]|jgi:hypothetical protein|nr:hypothetical protein SAMN04515619_11286 [Collimonas sp. OK412]